MPLRAPLCALLLGGSEAYSLLTAPRFDAPRGGRGALMTEDYMIAHAPSSSAAALPASCDASALAPASSDASALVPAGSSTRLVPGSDVYNEMLEVAAAATTRRGFWKPPAFAMPTESVSDEAFRHGAGGASLAVSMGTMIMPSTAPLPEPAAPPLEAVGDDSEAAATQSAASPGDGASSSTSAGTDLAAGVVVKTQPKAVRDPADDFRHGTGRLDEVYYGCVKLP